MSKVFEGKIVRFDKTGVGVVDVEGVDQYVYFTPKDIAGYGGETLEELKSVRHGAWKDGKIVVIDGEMRPMGNVVVKSVTLKR